jgi:hypothetical protein
MRAPILARGRGPTARGRCHLSRPRGSRTRSVPGSATHTTPATPAVNRARLPAPAPELAGGSRFSPSDRASVPGDCRMPLAPHTAQVLQAEKRDRPTASELRQRAVPPLNRLVLDEEGRERLLQELVRLGLRLGLDERRLRETCGDDDADRSVTGRYGDAFGVLNRDGDEDAEEGCPPGAGRRGGRGGLADGRGAGLSRQPWKLRNGDGRRAGACVGTARPARADRAARRPGGGGAVAVAAAPDGGGLRLRTTGRLRQAGSDCSSGPARASVWRAASGGPSRSGSFARSASRPSTSMSAASRARRSSRSCRCASSCLRSSTP